MKCAVIISFSFSASFVYGEVKGRLLYTRLLKSVEIRGIANLNTNLTNKC